VTFEEFKKLEMDARAKPRETYEEYCVRYAKSIHLDLVMRTLAPEWISLYDACSANPMPDAVLRLIAIENKLEHY